MQRLRHEGSFPWKSFFPRFYPFFPSLLQLSAAFHHPLASFKSTKIQAHRSTTWTFGLAPPHPLFPLSLIFPYLVVKTLPFEICSSVKFSDLVAFKFVSIYIWKFHNLFFVTWRSWILLYLRICFLELFTFHEFVRIYMHVIISGICCFFYLVLKTIQMRNLWNLIFIT